MGKYLNKFTKTIVVCLAGCVGFAEKLLESGFDKAADDLRIMKEAAERVMDNLMQGIDMDQVRAVLRYADASILMVIPRTSPQVDQEYYVVPESAMKVFRRQVTGECTFCEKQGKECKRCEVRKALADSMVVGNNTSADCPYKEY